MIHPLQNLDEDKPITNPVSNNLTEELEDLKRMLLSIPEAIQPPPTTLEIIRNYQQEQDWQRLLGNPQKNGHL